VSAPRPPPAYEPSWARRVPGWSLLLFFLSLAGLTAIAAYFNDLNEMQLAGYFAGLASTVPLLSILIPYYGRPVWAIQVPTPIEPVAGAIRDVLPPNGAEVITKREGAFARCTTVVSIASPRCAIGWYMTASPPGGVAIPPRSVVIFEARSGDRIALLQLRESLRTALRGIPQAM
jgi:hypothetical protein